jgi:hypothetical protein
MQFSTFSQNYADRWLLLHVAQIPFTLGDLIVSTKLFISLAAAGVVATIYLVMRKRGVKYPWFWVALLLSSSTFLWRVNLLRAYLFANIFLLLGFYFLSKKNYKGLFIISVLFPLTYSAYPLLLFFTVVFVVSEFIHKRRLEKKALLYCVLGLVTGLLINPYFPFNIFYSAAEVNTVLFGLRTTGYSTEQMEHLRPLETIPPTLSKFAQTSYVLLVFLALGAENYLFSKNKKIYSGRRVEITAAIMISVIFGLLYIASTRFSEYWIPFGVLASALCFEPILKRFSKKSFNLNFVKHKVSDISIVVSIVSIVLVSLSLYWAWDMSYGHQFQLEFRQDVVEVSNWLKSNTPEGSTVFVDWTNFAYLFFYNTHNYYIYGINPLDLYMYNKTLSDSYISIASGASHDMYQELVTNFQASYVAVAVEYQPYMLPDIENDQRFTKVFENNYWVVYEL